jgi:hypothetical protein
MAGIFTRKQLSAILAEETTPEEKADAIFSLYGRALDDGYVTKAAALADKEAAVEAAKKDVKLPPIQESSEYKALQAEFDGYKAMNNARTSADFSTVKPKFFEQVYSKIDRSEGAKPVKEQLDAIKQTYEEYFLPVEDKPNAPTFGGQTKGEPPKGDEGTAFGKYWGFVPSKKE